MTIKLDWLEGEDHPQTAWDEAPASLPLAPEPTRAVPQPRQRRLPLRLLAVAAAILVGGAILAGTLVLLRAGRGSELARQDIEAAALEILAAQQGGDSELLAGLLDPAVRAWTEDALDRRVEQFRGLPAAVAITSVTLDDSRATAEVRETFADQESLRRWAFFRRQDQLWLLTRPWPEAFGKLQVAESAHFQLQFREQDGPLAGHLINQAEGAYLALCGELHCRGVGKPLLLQLVYDGDESPPPRPGVVAVPSPWIVGVTEQGTPHPAWDAAFVRQLAQSLALLKAPNLSPALGEAIGGWAATSLAAAPDGVSGELLAARQTDSLPALGAAWTTIAVDNNREDRLALAEVQSFLAYLEAKTPSQGVGSLLEAIARTPDQLDLANLLRTAFDADLAQSEAAWLRWLAGNAPGNQTGAETG